MINIHAEWENGTRGLPGQIEQEMCINFARLYLRNGWSEN